MTESPSLSPAAERMRRYRERRRDNMRCVTIEIHEVEIDALVQKGLLRWEMRNDLIAVTEALHSFLDETLN